VVSGLRIYEDCSQSPDGWKINPTLRLEGDGRFVYDELWADYTRAPVGGGAAGSWRQDGLVFLFHAERVEGPLYHPWVAGQELEARPGGATHSTPGASIGCATARTRS
jgi:hypothetical protein